MDKSVLIFYAIPVFFLLIIIEFIYGLIVKNNTYRINDTFVSISIGLISRFPVILNLGFNAFLFTLAATTFNLKLLPLDSWVTWVIAFLMYDLTYYIQHRLHHEIKILWATHVVHHHGEEYNLATALRQTSTGFLWKWMFYVPMMVVGIPAEVFATVGGINLLYQYWVHTEHIPKLGWLEKIFITPSNHRVHHAKNPEYIDANYGGVFIIWDRIFGTYIEEKDDIRPVYGTVKALNSWNPVWANFQVFYNMFLDSMRTKKLSDKFKVWYAPTYWRPSDVEEKYPNKPVDLKNKYNPFMSTSTKVFAAIQMLAMILISNSLFLNINGFSYEQVAIFGVILVVIPTITALLMQNSSFALLGVGALNLAILIICLSGLVPLQALATQFTLFTSLINILFFVYQITFAGKYEELKLSNIRS
jgi:sterol desaturase/sphingolipid hydroxylase (fatty acid hydroxylase superfamily)